jgi:hypothetical protein
MIATSTTKQEERKKKNIDSLVYSRGDDVRECVSEDKRRSEY